MHSTHQGPLGCIHQVAAIPPLSLTDFSTLSHTMVAPISACIRQSTQNRRLNMAVERINREIIGLNLDGMTEGTVVPVCEATVAEWDAFVESEDQAFKSTHMEWIDGRIVIVEFPLAEHGSFCMVLNKRIWPDGVVDAHLQAYLASFIRTTTPKLEPDLSYGPMNAPMNAPLPAGLTRLRDWHTLKVEVGFSRRWGDSNGQLDWKANRWATVVGVRYVLCVAIWEDLARAEFNLYTVDRVGDELPEQDPTPVLAPHTNVSFDSRLLLGLQPRDVLPQGFPDPLTVDLYEVLVGARRGM